MEKTNNTIDVPKNCSTCMWNNANLLLPGKHPCDKCVYNEEIRKDNYKVTKDADAILQEINKHSKKLL